MRGGYRPGSGRKQGFAAKHAEEARKYLAERVANEIEPLADMLLEKAKGGDVRAIQILFDRAWGRPGQEVKITTPGEQALPSERIRHLANVLNGRS